MTTGPWITFPGIELCGRRRRSERVNVRIGTAHWLAIVEEYERQRDCREVPHPDQPAADAAKGASDVPD